MRQTRCRCIALSVVALLVLAACASNTDFTAPSAEQAVYAPVLLVSPELGGRFKQNDLTLGCTPHPARGSGFRLAFDWHDVPGATRYQIVFWHRGSQFPAVQGEVAASEYEEIACNSFVIDRNLHDWIWKVAALGPITPAQGADGRTAPRDTVLWSEERVFGFEPCRLADGRPCNAPAGS